jgi:hypothetical protein
MLKISFKGCCVDSPNIIDQSVIRQVFPDTLFDFFWRVLTSLLYEDELDKILLPFIKNINNDTAADQYNAFVKTSAGCEVLDRFIEYFPDILTPY